MTDKEIIIDGIDVSKCEYCLKMTKYRCSIQRDVYKCLCEENPNCYFKQSKRKEKECKKYKQTLTEIIRFLKEDKKFARYSGYPIVLTSIVIEEIEKILKENDIKINECEANQRKLKDD